MDTTADQLKKRFRLVTLGCRTNQYEGQAYRDQLLALGWLPAQEDESAHLCIVNTCTVTESADSNSRYAIRKLARENPEAEIVVTGCYADSHAAQAATLDGVTRVVPNKDKERLIDLVFPDIELPEFKITFFEAHTRAFVKIQDGCNSFCTYCIVPYVRGRSRSRSLEEIESEVYELVQNGYREVVLTGINIGDFDGGPSSGYRLCDLVKKLDAIPGLERLRLSSIDPDEVDDSLLDAIINGHKTCPSLHLVLQSGSNVVLKRMNRKYTRQIFLDTVARLQRARPDFTITTDVILGFPGETEADFEETLDVINKGPFIKVHCFPYSDRPRTRSALMPNKVSNDVMRDRKQRILRLAEKRAFELRQNYVGKVCSVLVEEQGADSSLFFGHTEHFLPVNIEFDPRLCANALLSVQLIGNDADGLRGRVV